jgi:hypothetical protein
MPTPRWIPGTSRPLAGLDGRAQKPPPQDRETTSREAQARTGQPSRGAKTPAARPARKDR